MENFGKVPDTIGCIGTYNMEPLTNRNIHESPIFEKFSKFTTVSFQEYEFTIILQNIKLNVYI